jgi:hypothetical protein
MPIKKKNVLTLFYFGFDTLGITILICWIGLLRVLCPKVPMKWCMIGGVVIFSLTSLALYFWIVHQPNCQ